MSLLLCEFACLSIDSAIFIVSTVMMFVPLRRMCVQIDLFDCNSVFRSFVFSISIASKLHLCVCIETVIRFM